MELVDDAPIYVSEGRPTMAQLLDEAQREAQALEVLPYVGDVEELAWDGDHVVIQFPTQDEAKAAARRLTAAGYWTEVQHRCVVVIAACDCGGIHADGSGNPRLYHDGECPYGRWMRGEL